MVDDKLRIFIEATDKASAAFSSVQKHVIGLVGAYLSFQAVEKVFHAAVAEIEAAVEAASAQEQADIRLSNAVSTLGGDTAGMTAHLKEQASALQRSTIYTDEQVQAAQALLVSLGRLSGQGLDRATKAAVALAQGLGVDLESAATLLSKAAQGNTQQLARYGIVLDESLSKSQKFEAVLSFVEKRFGSLAEAMGTSFQGRLIQAQHAFGELQETLGKLIIKNDTVVEALRQISLALANLNESFATQNFSEQVSTVAILFLKFAEDALIAATAASALFDVLRHEGSALITLTSFSTIQERMRALKEIFLSGFEISPLTKDLRELMNAAHDVTINVEASHAALGQLKQDLLDIQKGGIDPSEMARFLELIEKINKTKIAPPKIEPVNVADVTAQLASLNEALKAAGFTEVKLKVDTADIERAKALIASMAGKLDLGSLEKFRSEVLALSIEDLPLAGHALAGNLTLPEGVTQSVDAYSDTIANTNRQIIAMGESFQRMSEQEEEWRAKVDRFNDLSANQQESIMLMNEGVADLGGNLVAMGIAGELSFKNLAAAVRQFVGQLVAAIIRMLILQALARAFGAAVGGSAGAAAGGAIASGVGGTVGFGPQLSSTNIPITPTTATLSLSQGFLGVSDSFVRDLTEAQSRVARSYGVSIVPLGSLT